MDKIIEIIKFKITIFMTILAAAGFLAINCDKITKNFGENINILIWIVIFSFVFYGISGFIINFSKLNKIEKNIKEK
jgi:hypothetical protein